jgi:hypothetical protein
MVTVEIKPKKGKEQYYFKPYFFVCDRVEVKDNWGYFKSVKVEGGMDRAVYLGDCEVVID